jgi:hypothetical protein
MTKQQANFLVAATQHCGNQEAELRENYSGRGMYGRETFGVVLCDVSALLGDCIQYVKEAGLDGNFGILEYIPDIVSFRTDNMGMHTIIY